MSIFTRVSNHFNYMDTAYSDLYEKEVAFEEKPSDYNRKELQKSIDIFNKKFYNYKTIVKNVYIPPEIDIE